jgi:hypothetical protein
MHRPSFDPDSPNFSNDDPTWAEDRPPITPSPYFKCPRCARYSYNLNDVRERYCGACHEFFPLDIAGALEIVLNLARRAAATQAEREAVEVVADMATNQFGDD